MDKYIGRLLDNRYEILESIGTGGMAVVYKARCHRLNRLVAIKILKDDYLQDEEFRRRFHSESQAVAMLSHPNIVSVYDVSSSIMADYIVMELIDGITLKQYMEKKGTLNWKETLHFGIQIAKALEHAHSRGIVHRDIKPHNVMVLKNGSVKVMDFGIARMMSKGNTLTKEALGSVHYISPEQAKGGRVDSRSDIYSLGVVMYEMMAGRPPYDGDSPVSVAIQHINGGAVMPSTLNPNIPGGLEQIIMKAMAHEIGDRYVSATRMLSDMDEFRKNPSLLFDYNTPPLDAVTKMPPPLILHDGPASKPKTTTGTVPKQTPKSNSNQKTASQNSGNLSSAAERAARRAAQRNGQDGDARKRNREKDEQPRRKPSEKDGSRATTIAIIICSILALVAVGLLVYFIWDGQFSRNDDLVTVPNLVGKEYVEGAVDDLEIRIEEKYSNDIPKGQVISTNPAAGEKVAKGGKLVIYISQGPPKDEKMIDFKNMRADEAIQHLNSLGLDLKISTEGYEEFHATIPEGDVIRTVPPAGTPLTIGQEVIVYVSKGPGDAHMVDVVGKTKAKAGSALEDLVEKLNITIQYEEEFSSEVDKGKVTRTEPAANEQVTANQQVKVYISKGPEKKSMPNVVGLTPYEAAKKLTEAGFDSWDTEGDKSEGAVVLEQPFPEGEEVDVNTKIILKIGIPKITNTVVLDLTEDLKGIVIPESCKVVVTKADGTVVFENDLPEDNKVSFTDKGNGKVAYKVTINGIAVEDHEWEFK